MEMRRFALFLLLSVVFLHTGCVTTTRDLKSGFSSTGQTGESTSKGRKESDAFPYEKGWCAYNDLSGFTEIHIAPVNTDLLSEMDWWNSVDEETLRRKEKDLQAIAQYTATSFDQALRNNLQGNFTLVDSSGPDTLIFELALVEIIPSEDFLNTHGKLETSDNASIFESFNDSDFGSLTLEGRALDGESGGILLMFADRKKIAANEDNEDTEDWRRHFETIIDEWSRELAHTMKKKRYRDVKDVPPFRLKPW
jgi:hypothetical protein